MNIVIADDEEIILKWMRKNIEALSSENKVIEVCTNGKQVMNCCLNHRVDVLFTDIRMPVMDGMEMLKKLSDSHMLPYTIILSAYDDFSYARECLKIGVKEFLLKSEITKEELKKCLSQAAEELKKDNEDEAENYEEDMQMESLLKQIWKNQPISSSILKKYMEEIWKIQGDFAVILLYNYDGNFKMEHITELASFFFQEENLRFYSVKKEKQQIWMILELPKREDRVLGKRFHEALSSFGYRNVCVNISPRGHSYQELLKLHQCSESVLQYQIFYKSMTSLDYESMKTRQAYGNEKAEKFFEEIEGVMKYKDWDSMENKMLEGLQKVREWMPESSLMKRLVLNLILNLYWNGLDEEKRKDIIIEEIVDFSRVQDIDIFEKNILYQIRQFLSKLRYHQPIYSEAVGKMIEYVENRYQESVSLDELAEYVHMNRTYVSHLFKKETGDTLNNFLLQMRLKQAKKLLLGSKDSIQVICEQVGIPDSAYFSKVFKKQMGLSPLEFRKENKKIR